MTHYFTYQVVPLGKSFKVYEAQIAAGVIRVLILALCTSQVYSENKTIKIGKVISYL